MALGAPTLPMFTASSPPPFQGSSENPNGALFVGARQRFSVLQLSSSCMMAGTTSTKVPAIEPLSNLSL